MFILSHHSIIKDMRDKASATCKACRRRGKLHQLDNVDPGALIGWIYERTNRLEQAHAQELEAVGQRITADCAAELKATHELNGKLREALKKIADCDVTGCITMACPKDIGLADCSTCPNNAIIFARQAMADLFGVEVCDADVRR